MGTMAEQVKAKPERGRYNRNTEIHASVVEIIEYIFEVGNLPHIPDLAKYLCLTDAGARSRLKLARGDIEELRLHDFFEDELIEQWKEERNETR